ncbi:MAG: hypothetical protein RLZZ428_391 [Pseudomonadota bacterium]|jgi:predicted Fe-Mo cluster-binding NifX family protein
MYILIPCDGTDEKNSKITTLAERLKWAFIDFDNGHVKSTQFFDEREEAGVDWIDFVILANKYENYLDFMNEGMMCLVRREEETLEEVMSAFVFKELDEIGM